MPTPYLPMVNAIAPKAPIGANRMMIAITPKSDVRELIEEIDQRSSLVAEPRQRQAEQDREDSTWRISPLANAPTAESGMMCSRRSTVESGFAPAV